MRPLKVLVIGLGYFGRAVMETLTQMDHSVVGIDKDEKLVESLKDKLEDLRIMDATDEEALQRLDISDFDVCVVGTGSDLGNSVLLTATLKRLGARFIVAKAVTEQQAEILKKIGADLVVFPEKEMGKRLAHQLLSPGRIMEHLEFDPEWSLEEIEAPTWMIGKTLKDLNLRRQHGVTVIAIRRDKKVLPNPDGEAKIEEKDLLLVFGKNRDLEKLISR